MRTPRIKLYYSLTQTAVNPPPQKDILRKDVWLKEVQKSVEADFKPLLVEVTYELYNPEVVKQQRFFHTCVKYYAIQDMDLLTGGPDNESLKKYREEILDDLLGYDFQTVNKVVHRRKSTKDFKTVQAWNNLLKTLEETQFEAAGYEFPDSKQFWEWVKEHGYDQAQGIAIVGLQKRMAGRTKV